MGSTLEDLGGASYLLVTTFRKDGTAVPTPVWAARDGDAISFWTVVTTGKIKRIGRNPEVLVAQCDRRGRPRGDAAPGRAAVLDAEGTARVRVLLKKKYGLQARVALAFSRLFRGTDGTIGVRIVLD